jgi:hypothetical protein
MIAVMRAVLRYFTMFFFNLLPLIMVGAGIWRPFDMMAFYWVELVAILGFTLLKIFVTTVYDFYHRKYGRVAGGVATLVFFPLHYGFFIVMMCFLVGSFLPPETPTRLLDSPLVPLQVVMDNMPFVEMLALATSWQAIYFCADFLFTRAYARDDRSDFISRPYASLFAVFISGFIGVWIMVGQGARIWGVVVLTALKTLIAFFETRHLLQKEAEENKAL